MNVATATPGTPSARDFERVRGWLYERSGISLGQGKLSLVGSRLARRLRERGVDSFEAYLGLLADPTEGAERQCALDLLTTNETFFFREARHFEHVAATLAAAARGRKFRAWSAASSSGEEAYSLAMVLAEALPTGAWEILGTDISQRVLATAREGRYPLARAGGIPRQLLERYCLRGVGAQEGSFLVSRELRSRTRFEALNLNAPLPDLGAFDAIFLRNVMIYFDAETKQRLVAKIAPLLVPGGHLYIGHSESLGRNPCGLDAIAPAIYRRP